MTRDEQHAMLDTFLDRARNWPHYHSLHEAFAVLLEEVDELKAQVWTAQSRRNVDELRAEALDVAAVAMRIFVHCNDEGWVRR